MAKDFKTNQIQTNKIIASGSTGTGAKLLIYSNNSDNSSNPNQGLIDNTKFNTSSIGTDVFLYVSGGKDSKNTSNTNTVSVFGGDVVISGNIYSGSLQITDTSGTNIGTGSLIFSGSNNGDLRFYSVIGGGPINVFNSGNHLVVSSAVIVGTGSVNVINQNGTLIISGAVVNPDSIYSFFHEDDTLSTGQARRLFQGYSNRNWSTTIAWEGAYVVPDDGNLIYLITHTSGVTSGGTNNITYRVWISTNNRTSFVSTTLSTTKQADDPSFTYSAVTIPVSRGNFFGVECTADGSVTLGGVGGGFKAEVGFIKT